MSHLFFSSFFYKKLFLFACLLLSHWCFSQDIKNDWVLKKNENEIAIYDRSVTNSNLKELKSVVYLKTSLSSIVALVSDWENYPEWVYHCGQSTTLKKISDTEVIHYQTVLIPSPAQKRDFVINIKVSQDAETKVITIKSICNSNYIPPVENYIRIKEFSACWTLIPLKDGTVQITYQLLCDQGGDIPVWLANFESVHGAYETMVHFKEWLWKKKYQEAKLAYIQELN